MGVVACLVVSAAFPIALTPAPAPDAKVSPALLSRASAERASWFLVDLREQLDYARIGPRVEGLSRARRRAWVARALRTIADRSQRRLRPLLAALERSGEVEAWSGVSIVNRLIVNGRLGAIRALASRPEVASLVEEIEAEGAPEAAGEAARAAPAPWPLEAMGVRPARQAGIDGTGVTIGLIDSGATARHERLRGSFRGGSRSWFDPLHGSVEPSDVQLGHGTGVLGCALEVAPGARWVAAVGLDEGRYDNLLVTRAADWTLQRAQPDVLVVPWRVPGDRCDRSLRPILDAWSAAGILVVFAAGNGGPLPSSDVPPANSAGALSVGAVDAALAIDPQSSRGPNSCGPALFPQLVAPGAGVRVAFPAAPSLYRDVSGTSYAAGFVAGVAALLLQRCPRVAAARIEDALRQSALDLGPPGPDSTYGHGLVHAGRALDALGKLPECR
jgi:subtilisin family serine protease